MKFKKTSLSLLERVTKLMQGFHMRPVQKMEYKFDPFSPNVTSIRQVLHHLNTKKVLSTGTVKTKIDVTSDRSPPQIDVLFNDGHRVIFKTENLSLLDILEKMDKFCKAKDTYVPETDAALTKVSGKPKSKKK